LHYKRLQNAYQTWVGRDGIEYMANQQSTDGTIGWIGCQVF
jgi:hypothetical protein